MTSSNIPTPVEFERRFRDVIRVGFNWDRFLREQWPVEIVKLDSASDLARCFTPWYVGKFSEELPYDHPHAVPMSLSDVPKAFMILSEERRTDIQAKIDQIRNRTGTVRFIAPTYSLPNDNYFVLDKNHSLSSIALSGNAFEVELWNVRGPFEKDSLLDLEFWLKELNSE